MILFNKVAARVARGQACGPASLRPRWTSLARRARSAPSSSTWIMVARLARRLARGSRFGGLDALPLALLGGSAFGLGCGRAAAVAWPPSVVDALGHVLARPGPAHVVGGVGLHLDGGARAAVRCGSRLRHTACSRRPKEGARSDPAPSGVDERGARPRARRLAATEASRASRRRRPARRPRRPQAPAPASSAAAAAAAPWLGGAATSTRAAICCGCLWLLANASTRAAPFSARRRSQLSDGPGRARNDHQFSTAGALRLGHCPAFALQKSQRQRGQNSAHPR